MPGIRESTPEPRPPTPLGGLAEDWLNQLRAYKPETAVPGYWDTLEENCKQWADDISVSPFWKAAREQVSSWATEFRRTRGDDLLSREGLPMFLGKAKTRTMTKAYKACSELGTFDASRIWPSTGPPVPTLNDLVRTRVECRFLDGVEHLTERMCDLAASMGLNPERSRKGSLEGYFAQHLYFSHAVFFRFGGSHEATTIRCEIQIATELSTRIWEAAHGIYEEWREKPDKSDDWQWNPQDPRFVARQLGHMIHLADGILVQLRDVVTGRKGRAR